MFAEGTVVNILSISLEDGNAFKKLFQSLNNLSVYFSSHFTLVNCFGVGREVILIGLQYDCLFLIDQAALNSLLTPEYLYERKRVTD